MSHVKNENASMALNSPHTSEAVAVTTHQFMYLHKAGMHTVDEAAIGSNEHQAVGVCGISTCG